MQNSEKKSMILMNYIFPVMQLSGKYVYNYLDSTQANKDEKKYPLLFTFVAEDIKILNEKLIPHRLISYINNPSELVKHFNIWFNSRIITSKRTSEINILKAILDKKNIEEKCDIEDITFSSVSDKYWLSKHNMQITPEDFERKQNKLKSKLKSGRIGLGDIFFTKNNYLLDNPEEININSGLELLNDYNYCLEGVVNKKWVLDENDNNIYLYKQRNKKYEQDPINEYLSTILLDKLAFDNFDYVKYSIDICGYAYCSKSKSFVGEKEEFVKMFDIMNLCKRNNESNIYNHVIKCLDAIKIPYGKEFIDTMIVIDRMTMNFDRHLGNFGVIRNVETGEFTHMAPLFDMGGCFFNGYDTAGIKLKNNQTKTLIFSERAEELEKEGKIPKFGDSEIEEIKKILDEYAYANRQENNIIIQKINEINKNNSSVQAPSEKEKNVNTELTFTL